MFSKPMAHKGFLSGLKGDERAGGFVARLRGLRRAAQIATKPTQIGRKNAGGPSNSASGRVETRRGRF